MCSRYANFKILEEGYGINLLPLVTFAMDVYGDDPCTIFRPKGSDAEGLNPKQARLVAQMHKAITIIQFKLEYEIIKRRPEYGMDDRNLLHMIDYEKGTVTIDGKEYLLRDKNFPTIDPQNPYKLTPEERIVVEKLTHNFEHSAHMAKHMQLLYSHGALYLVRNSNLLYHGSVPLNEDGTFKVLNIQGKDYSGKALFDKIDQIVRQAYFETDKPGEKLFGQDFVWYLWCGPESPLFGKAKMATFERYLLDDKEVQKEPKGWYYILRDNAEVCDYILDEFGVKGNHRHIINGHVPVRVFKGETPIKADGRLMVIDGGFSKIYHNRTGIAGYTLVYHSRGFELVQLTPFTSTEEAILNGTDIAGTINIVEIVGEREKVRDTDIGRGIMVKIADLERLLYAYRKGVIKERPQ